MHIPDHREIVTLLAPVAPSEFVTEYWRRQSLYLPGEPDKLAMLGLDDGWFQRALARQSMNRDANAQHLRAQFYDRQGKSQIFPIAASYASVLHSAGMTVCVTGIHRFIEPLNRFARLFKHSLGLSGHISINCYYSSDGGGFELHADTQSVFILQVEGAKHWYYAAEPTIASPLEAITDDPDELEHFHFMNPTIPVELPNEADLVQQVLTPGDLLYMAPGTWHRAVAEGTSLALTVTCVPWSFGECTQQWLVERMRLTPSWRLDFPATWMPEQEPGSVPADIEHFLGQRLAELRSAISKLTPSDLIRLWKAQRQSIRSSPSSKPATNHVPEQSLERPIERTDVFTVHHPLDYSLTVTPDNISSLVLYAVDTTLALPPECEPFIDTLARRVRFEAREGMSWSDNDIDYDWEDVVEALTALLHKGVISRADNEDCTL